MSSEHGSAVEDDVEVAALVVKKHRKRLDKMRRALEECLGELDEVLEGTGFSERNLARLKGIRKEEQKAVDQIREVVSTLEGLPKWLRLERPTPPSSPTAP